MAINFYRTTGQYGCFSNFYRAPIHMDGWVWPTSEHDFQAQKTLDEDRREEIRKAPKAMTAARLGRDREKTIRREGWEEMRVEIMRQALRAKFTQHTDLRDILLATGEEDIVEHTANDDFWADGGDGSGENMLGKLLMELRDELRAEEAN